MNLRVTALAMTAALLAPAISLADGPAYDDPGMHFQAPDGWERIDLGSNQQSSGDEERTLAMFVLGRGSNDPRTILITSKPFEDSLDALVTEREGDLRKNPDNPTYINRHEALKLGNGMPAYLLVSTTSPENTAQVKVFEYLVIDGKRGIDVRYFGYTRDVDDDKAAQALSSLYVVAARR